MPQWIKELKTLSIWTATPAKAIVAAHAPIDLAPSSVLDPTLNTLEYMRLVKSSFDYQKTF